jgi:hypothetical protein
MSKRKWRKATLLGRENSARLGWGAGKSYVASLPETQRFQGIRYVKTPVFPTPFPFESPLFYTKTETPA